MNAEHLRARVILTGSGGVLTVGFPGGPEINYMLGMARGIDVTRLPANHRQPRRSRLKEIAESLRAGSIVFVISDAAEVIIPRGRSEQATVG